MINAKNSTIVVCRYNEDIEWTQKLIEQGIRVFVYNKGKVLSSPYYVPKNVGNEAAAYLKYIIDFYDNLSQYTIFLHGSNQSWHHHGKLTDMILNMMTRKIKIRPYHNLNNRCTQSVKNDLFPHVRKFFQEYLSPYIGDIEEYGDWTIGKQCCSQFILHKKRIHEYPLRFYKDIYNWMMEEKTLTPKEQGLCLEWTWSIIFENPQKHKPFRLKNCIST